jgi:acyltransferase
MKRQDFIDQLKALSIFLIVFGHNDEGTMMGDYFTTFRLPLFFIISGYLGKDKQNIPWGEFIAKTTRRLLVPYFLISILLFSYWFFIKRHVDLNPTPRDPLLNLIGIAYATGGQHYMAWGSPMWYLPALFCMAVIDYLVAKLPFHQRLFPALGLPILGVLAYSILDFHLPWSLDIAMVAYLFYFFGTYIRRIDLIQYIRGKEVWVFLVFLMVHIIGASFHNPANFQGLEFQNLPWIIVNGLTGFMWLFALFLLIPAWKPLTWVGKNTLPILAFHLLALDVLYGVAYYIFGFKLEFTQPGRWN